MAKKNNIQTTIFNSTTPEFFINMKNIPTKGSDDRRAFILEEKRKCREGININGIYIPGSLYFHLNYYKLAKDVKDSTGKTVKEFSLPDLRDNEWIVFNDYEEAQKQSKSYTLFGLRQAGKSELECSLCLRELCLYQNTEALALFSAKPDKDTFVKKMKIAIDEGEKFIIIPNIDQDWSKELIRFGVTKVDNKPDVKSSLYIYNTQEGAKIQVGSGKTPTFVLMDEVGKSKFKLVYDAVEPALLDDFGGLRCSPLFTFTGGERDKSVDAENMIRFPNADTQLCFEYEGKTVGGRFLNGEYRKDCKINIPLSQYLNKTTNTWLDNYSIKITDSVKAKEVINKERENALKSPDKKSFMLKRIFFPLSLEDVFLSENENPFPKEALEQQKQFLLSNPIGQNIELFRGMNGVVQLKFSNKFPISKYPVNSTDNLDAPIVMYDSPEKFKGQKGLHVIGIDTYNDDEAPNSDSLGSIYVFRKFHSDLSDVFNGCMVASYTARPKTMKEFNETCLMLAEFYDATIMYEHTGGAFKDFFGGKNKEHLLIQTPSLTKEISPNSSSGNTTGVRPTVPIKKHALNLTLDYDNEELADGRLGVSRILDPVLIDEKLAYDGVKNTDRYIAFSMGMEALYMYKKYTTIVNYEEKIETQEVKKRNNAFGFVINKSVSLQSNKNPFGL